MKAILSLALFSLLISSLLAEPYEHDKWGTSPSDHIRQFDAFISSFDSDDDNDGDTDADIWGIPEWVAFEIKGNQPLHKAERPSWVTDEDLHNQGIAPDDDTYKVSGINKLKIVKGSYRFVRGHMCPKSVAQRISKQAAIDTHTMINAVPQLQWQNNGIWKKLEKQCTDWADEFERVWVICGPVFFGKNPALWLGQEDEIKAAVPDALFKIVIREDDIDTIETIAFIIPNIIPENHSNYWAYLTTIKNIEDLTGLDFLSNLNSTLEKRIEQELGAEW